MHFMHVLFTVYLHLHTLKTSFLLVHPKILAKGGVQNEKNVKILARLVSSLRVLADGFQWLLQRQIN